MSNVFFSDYDYEQYIQAVLEDLNHSREPDDDECDPAYSGEPVTLEEREAEWQESFEYLVKSEE